MESVLRRNGAAITPKRDRCYAEMELPLRRNGVGVTP